MVTVDDVTMNNPDPPLHCWTFGGSKTDSCTARNQGGFPPTKHFSQLTCAPQGSSTNGPTEGVVYSVPCDGCSKVYIGQTGWSLKHRLAEHRRALKNGDVAASALAEHTLATGHPVDLTKSEVIDCHPYATTRCLLESWHIQRNPDALNREKGTLPEVYTALLE